MKMDGKMNMAEFIKAVQTCTEDVWFRTEDGDNLNLKSTLSQYLLAAMAGNEQMLNQGWVVCDNESDYVRLKEFLR